MSCHSLVLSATNIKLTLRLTILYIDFIGLTIIRYMLFSTVTCLFDPPGSPAERLRYLRAARDALQRGNVGGRADPAADHRLEGDPWWWFAHRRHRPLLRPPGLLSSRCLPRCGAGGLLGPPALSAAASVCYGASTWSARNVPCQQAPDAPCRCLRGMVH